MTTDPGVAPSGYFEHFYAQRDWRWYAWILSHTITHSRPGPILDVGAGNGLLTEAASRWGLDAQGVEGSSDAIAQALARFPEARIRAHNLSQPLPFADASFQTVFMNQVIEHLEPDVGANTVREIFRVLRPEGLLFIQSPSCFDKYEAGADPDHVHVYRPGELARLLRHTGFEPVQARNAPLRLLGSGSAGRAVMTGAFQLLPWERLSATANFLAWKPAQ